MDFLNSIQWGNVFTAVTLITTAFLAWSDVSKRRAEKRAKDSESHKIETDAADVITESALKLLTPKDKQIEQQDLQITRLLAENQQLSNKFNILESSTNNLIKRVSDLENVNNELIKQSEEWKTERKEWELGIGKLLSQLVKAKIAPVWLPQGITISEIELEPKLVISGFGSKKVNK
jgi:chromosome segregation ATPase